MQHELKNNKELIFKKKKRTKADNDGNVYAEGI